MSDAPVIEFRDVHKEFRLGLNLKRVHAVRGASFAVRRGEIFGFLGPNGAGKTTSMKCAMGLIKPTSGSISVLGGTIDDPGIRRRIGYLPEHPYFYDYLTAREILDFFGKLYEIPHAERRKRIRRLLDLVGLGHAGDRRLRQFSKGMLQRIGTAQALLNDPELVVMDEPLSGLDPMGRKELRDIIVQLREEGRTVFVTSHILHDIEMISDRVALIIHGTVERIGALDELLEGGDASDVDVIATGVSEALQGQLGAAGAVVTSLGVRRQVRTPSNQLPDVLRLLLDGGATVSHVTPRRMSLEEVFVRAAEARREG